MTRAGVAGARAYSIGFTRKSAEAFFGALRQAGIRRLVDIRLRNASTLAGFTRGGDLPYFLRELVAGAEYVREPLLAPSDALFRGIKGRTLGWAEYERGFLALMAERRVDDRLDRTLFAVPTVLLCSEPSAARCHRRLVLEYLAPRWPGGLEIVHL